MGRQYRTHTADFVVEHVRYVVEELGIGRIYFVDDNLGQDRKRFEAILDGLIELNAEGLGVTWETPNGIRTDRLTFDILKKAKRAGCRSIMLTVESGSQRVLDEVRALLPADQRPSLRAGFSRLSGESYDDMVRRYLAVSGPDDPRYDDLLIGSIVSGVNPDFGLLWAALFTRNEWQYGEHDYAIFLDVLLRELSYLRSHSFAYTFHQQDVLVTGHIACRDGYTVVADRQLRLASGSHAHPRQSARYLLFDVEKPSCMAMSMSGMPGPSS